MEIFMNQYFGLVLYNNKQCRPTEYNFFEFAPEYRQSSQHILYLAYF